MRKLLTGLMKYRRDELPQRRAMFKKLADEGQSPDVLFIACSDSRIDPNLLVSGEPGDLFMLRTIGNLIAPSDATGAAVGDVSEAAAIEYSLVVLGVRDIVVCGHSHCGAMKAVLGGKETLSGVPHLVEWLDHGVPSLDRVKRAKYIDHSLPLVEQLSQVNVLQQLDHVRSYPLVREREAKGEVHLHGWWFDVATGDTQIFDRDRGGFVTIDDELAERSAAHELSAPQLAFDED